MVEIYPEHPDSPGPEHLNTHTHTQLATLPITPSKQKIPAPSPLSAVLVAGLALARPIGELPDEGATIA